MGPHLKRDFPKFVQQFLDRHGKPRFYFRRPGFKLVALPGLPWSPTFMAAYEAALAGQPAAIGRASKTRNDPSACCVLFQFARLPRNEGEQPIRPAQHH